MYDPIYSNNIGLCGFRCRAPGCRKVVPTYRGIVMHCKRVHGLEAQMEIPGMEKRDAKSKTAKQSEPIREQRSNTGQPPIITSED